MPGKIAYKSEAEKQTSPTGHLCNIWGGHTYAYVVTTAIQQWLQVLVYLPAHLQGIHMNLVEKFAVNREVNPMHAHWGCCKQYQGPWIRQYSQYGLVRWVGQNLFMAPSEIPQLKAVNSEWGCICQMLWLIVRAGEVDRHKRRLNMDEES